MANLKRHLLCLNLADGKINWDTSVPAELPEQDRIRENHGYASSTPVTDGERIYAFFGKSGVFAFDFTGKELWRTNVGAKLNAWGSVASPGLYNELVFVNASIESESLVALDKKTGKEMWRAGGIKESWQAPAFVEANGKTEVVVATCESKKRTEQRKKRQRRECDGDRCLMAFDANDVRSGLDRSRA
jgi:outer membrane protein assembly factor BamB